VYNSVYNGRVTNSLSVQISEKLAVSMTDSLCQVYTYCRLAITLENDSWGSKNI